MEDLKNLVELYALKFHAEATKDSEPLDSSLIDVCTDTFKQKIKELNGED